MCVALHALLPMWTRFVSLLRDSATRPGSVFFFFLSADVEQAIAGMTGEREGRRAFVSMVATDFVDVACEYVWAVSHSFLCISV